MIKEIKSNVRVSFTQATKSGNVYYTFEYGETVEDNFDDETKYQNEKQALWNRCNEEVNKQIIETKNLYKQGN